MHESAHKLYWQMLNPVHNQGLRLCLGAFRTFPIESLYDNAHEPCMARCAKLPLKYASKIKSLPKHPIHDVVFDNKYTEQEKKLPATLLEQNLMKTNQGNNCYMYAFKDCSMMHHLVQTLWP